MIGIVLSEPVEFRCDKNYITFEMNLIQPNRRKNVIHVLVYQDYEYIPEVGDTVEIAGNLCSFDLGSKEGVRLYVSVVTMFPTESTAKSSDDNLIHVRGVIQKTTPVREKEDTGRQVVRFALLPDNSTHNKIPVYCILTGSAASSVSSIKVGMEIALKGRLITRKFTYKDSVRQTTELHVQEFVLPGLIQSKKE